MKTILIISPDPESRRTLELAFELKGWKVEVATTANSTTKAAGTNLVLLDMVEGLADFKKDKATKLPHKTKVLALLPLGADEQGARKIIPKSFAVIRRPYELLHLIQTAGEIVS
jgi:DNA-binding response OmpR family regulator